MLKLSKMKRKIISISAAWMIGAFGLLFIAGSCKKALEVKAYSNFTSENFYSTVDEAYMATLGVYAAVSSGGGYGWFL